MPEPKPGERRLIYDGRVIDLAIDGVELPDGRQIELEVVRHPGASAVVPITAEGRAVLVRQYRHATGGWLLEVPAGKLDPGESPLEAAQRELEEEVGLRAQEWIELGPIWTTPGFCNERIWRSFWRASSSPAASVSMTTKCCGSRSCRSRRRSSWPAAAASRTASRSAPCCGPRHV